MDDDPTTSATQMRGRPVPAAERILVLLAREEPNDPASPDGTLADVFDQELAPGLREWAGALEFAAAKIQRHDGAASGATEQLEELGCMLAQAATIATQTGSVLRGQLRPWPWQPAGQPPTRTSQPSDQLADQPPPAKAPGDYENVAGDDAIGGEGQTPGPPPEAESGVEPEASEGDAEALGRGDDAPDGEEERS